MHYPPLNKNMVENMVAAVELLVKNNGDDARTGQRFTPFQAHMRRGGTKKVMIGSWGRHH